MTSPDAPLGEQFVHLSHASIRFQLTVFWSTNFSLGSNSAGLAVLRQVASPPAVRFESR
jgi:hypothetical protein